MLMLLLGANLLAQQKDPALAAARSLNQENKYKEAIAQLKDLAASRPGTKGISHELGTAYYYQADYFEAASYLEEALRENLQDRDATQLLGLSLLQRQASTGHSGAGKGTTLVSKREY